MYWPLKKFTAYKNRQFLGLIILQQFGNWLKCGNHKCLVSSHTGVHKFLENAEVKRRSLLITQFFVFTVILVNRNVFKSFLEFRDVTVILQVSFSVYLFVCCVSFAVLHCLENNELVFWAHYLLKLLISLSFQIAKILDWV